MILFVIYLGEGFGKLMDTCKTSEVSGLVITLQEILSKFR